MTLGYCDSEFLMKPLYPLSELISIDIAEKRIKNLNGYLHAVTCYKPMDLSKELHVLVKDNIGVEGFPTTAGSYALRNLYLKDAPCIQRLKKSGIVDIFGKTTMTELAGFVSTDPRTRGYSELGGQGKNPHGESLTPGGSSSGSAIAVASGFCEVALGTETNGSLMIPGLANGVYAFKPTRGMISSSGIIPLSSTFDTPGIIARSISSLNRVFSIMKEANKKLDSIHKDSIRLAFLNFKNKPIDPELEIYFQYLKRTLCEVNIEIVTVDVEETKFDYRLISNWDFRHDVDRFLRKASCPNTPQSFDELYECYYQRDQSHPFGMNRLEEAATINMSSEKHADLVSFTLQRARNTIDFVLQQTESEALIRFDYCDWWAISGFPSLTVPIGKRQNKAPIVMMIGGSFATDLNLLRIGKRIEELKLYDSS